MTKSDQLQMNTIIYGVTVPPSHYPHQYYWGMWRVREMLVLGVPKDVVRSVTPVVGQYLNRHGDSVADGWFIQGWNDQLEGSTPWTDAEHEEGSAYAEALKRLPDLLRPGKDQGGRDQQPLCQTCGARRWDS